MYHVAQQHYLPLELQELGIDQGHGRGGVQCFADREAGLAAVLFLCEQISRQCRRHSRRHSHNMPCTLPQHHANHITVAYERARMVE
jgi:hypothetical protein